MEAPSVLGGMETRLCACCGMQKTIRGVWYLTPASGQGRAPFVCETCFVSAPLYGSA